LRNTGPEIKFGDCAEYIGVTGHWKGHFISFEISIKRALCLNLGISYATFSKTDCAQEISYFWQLWFQNSSDHKTVKFGRNTHVHWDYNPKNYSVLRGWSWKWLISVLFLYGMICTQKLHFLRSISTCHFWTLHYVALVAPTSHLDAYHVIIADYRKLVWGWYGIW
jgi:hypothetical protein